MLQWELMHIGVCIQYRAIVVVVYCTREILLNHMQHHFSKHKKMLAQRCANL